MNFFSSGGCAFDILPVWQWTLKEQHVEHQIVFAQVHKRRGMLVGCLTPRLPCLVQSISDGQVEGAGIQASLQCDWQRSSEQHRETTVSGSWERFEEHDGVHCCCRLVPRNHKKTARKTTLPESGALLCRARVFLEWMVSSAKKAKLKLEGLQCTSAEPQAEAHR